MKKITDYEPLEYLVKKIKLKIDLSKTPVQATSILTITPNPDVANHSTNLKLDGENMTLEHILLDGVKLNADQYQLNHNSLTVKNIPQGKTFELCTTTNLGENKDLFGLYETEGTVLVKSETEGFRRVAFFNDRPDNLAVFETTIIASKKKYPVLLANGTIKDRSELPNGLHSITWEDKIPKPSYLFAMVAGNLEYSSVPYINHKGEEIPICFYVPHKATAQCNFAKQVLQKVMGWDENDNNLPCKLPQHMVTGVPKYASGASEPTGLNIFNDQNLYASAAYQTDSDFLRVLLVVAHEYLHLWSGDLVTIRDWFNLTLKEGFTEFRTNMFREHLFGGDIVRLMNRAPLDPRPPRHSSYESVRSLYTPAAYGKGAEVFRMMMLVVGQVAFNKALTKYFLDNEGKAVTLEVLIDSLTKTTQVDLSPYLSWFDESGIPELRVTDEYNPKTQKYTVTFETIDGKSRPIPCPMGLIDAQGKELANTMLIIDQPKKTFTFDAIPTRPVPSLLRSNSAPVTLKYNYSNEDLLHLVRYDSNIYNRCNASRNLILKIISEYCAPNSTKSINDALTVEFFDTYKSLFKDKTLDDWLLAEILTLPSEEELIVTLPKPNFEKIAAAYKQIKMAFAVQLKADLHQRFNDVNMRPTYSRVFHDFSFNDSKTRRLLTACYSYFQFSEPTKTEKDLEICFNESLGINMSQTISVLKVLIEMDSVHVDSLLDKFYEKYRTNSNAMNHWYRIQASIHNPRVIKRIEMVMASPAFDISNPNNVYALLMPFISNPYGFHDISGQGYKLVVDAILKLDAINPPVAAKLTEGFINWDQFDATRSKSMYASLEIIYRKSSSLDVRSIAKKGLDKANKEPPTPLEVTLFAPPRPTTPKKGHKTEVSAAPETSAIMQGT